MSIFLVLFVCAIPWAAYVYVLQAREVGARSERRSFQARVVRGLLFIGLFGVIGLVKVWFGHKIHLQFGSHPSVNTPPGAAGRTNRPHVVPQNPTFQWPVLWGFLIVVAAGAALWWFNLRHRVFAPPPAEEELSFQDQIAASIDDALDDLAAEPDARRAVIAAYARMEQTFAGHGFKRRPSETPVEYLRRLLLGLTSRSEAVRRLTDLFEQAKFSRHEITSTMKEDAIDSLRVIRDDLRLAPA
jgi:hypothetical protein